MIDPQVEELITPAATTALYPRGVDGKKVHISKVYRHIDRGVRGIVLESIRTPRLATSRQAVARFFRRLSEASRPMSPDVTNDLAHGRANQQVEKELDRLGF